VGEKCCVVFGIELLGWKGPPITDHGAKGAPRMQLPGHCSHIVSNHQHDNRTNTVYSSCCPMELLWPT
jgi:hypothetical protein